MNEGELLTGTHRWVANQLLERRGRTDRRIGIVELSDLSEDIQEMLLELYQLPDMWLLQEAFESFLVGGWVKIFRPEEIASEFQPVREQREDSEGGFICRWCGTDGYDSIESARGCCYSIDF